MQTTTHDVLQVLLYFGALITLSPLLGRWMHRLLAPPAGSRDALDAVGSWLTGRAAWTKEMGWGHYLGALLIFNAAGLVVLLLLQLLQARLPGNPAGLGGVPFALAWNTAVSFVTNTNWQAYSGEATMSSLTQMAGLAVQNFLSAATGIAVLTALGRGLGSRGDGNGALGNFWRDLARCTLGLLLPLSLVLALALAGQGVVQTFDGPAEVTTLEGAAQTIPLGPAASQIAIKQLGTNGGGFFGVNSAHPLENPTPLSNFLQMLSILLLPGACVFFFARLVGSPRHGWVVFSTMLALLAGGFAVAWYAEAQGSPVTGLPVALEGKETRFGVMNSTLWAAATSAASNGSVNAMHDSLSPLAGGMALFHIMLGEVVFGGVGAGMYGMTMFILLTVFIAGLMVGRSPEYLGKRVESGEVIWAVLAVVLPSAVILLGSALSCRLPGALASLNNAGPHGLSEIVYAWSSAAGNNGSAFGGLNANTDWYNQGLGLAMLLGRYGVIVPALALAGRFAVKTPAPPSAGTFPTDGATFGFLLGGTILILGGLTFLPVLSLGPIVEHLLLGHDLSF